MELLYGLVFVSLLLSVFSLVWSSSNDRTLRQIMEVLKLEQDDDDYIDPSSKVLDDLSSKVDSLFVKNFFTGCPCCKNTEDIPKSEAVEFEKVHSIMFGSPIVRRYYTDKEGYDSNKEKIQSWKTEAEKYKKLK